MSDEQHKKSRQLAERQLANLNLLNNKGNPIANQIAANKIWNDHLVRSGIRR